jgi:hypothetical protein
MRARFIVLFTLLAATAAAGAGAEINLGVGASYEGGNSPISPVMPVILVETIFPVRAWEVFGVDFSISTAPAVSASYVNGLSAGPVLSFAADLSYHFPPLGPAEISVLVGGVGFQEYEKRADGVAAQAGAAAMFRFGSFFVQGRGLYRFFSSTGTSGAPVPLGSVSIGVLGGYSFR